jgi:hypothetical protein
MNKDSSALVELGLYKGDRRDQVLENVRVLDVIQGNLLSNESFRDRARSPHYCKDALNVVCFESVGIFGAVEVSNPKAR